MHPLARIGMGLGAVTIGVLVFRYGNVRGGEAFDTGPQGPRDSGFYYFVMVIGVLLMLGGAYQIPLAWKDWSKRRALRKVDRDAFD